MKNMKKILLIIAIPTIMFLIAFIKVNAESNPVIMWNVSNLNNLLSIFEQNNIDEESITKIHFNDISKTNVIIESDINIDVTNRNSEGSVNLLIKDDILYIQYEGILYFDKYSSSIFSSFPNVTEIKGFEYVNTSNVTSMTSMFEGMTSLKSLDLSSFDTSNVTSMYSMFEGMTSLTSLDLSSFDTSNVTSMYSMFNGMASLKSLDLSSFDTSNVTSMFSMFEGMTSLTSLDLSSFDTSNVTNMSLMFKGTDSLVEINVSGWNITDPFSFPNSKKIIAKNIIFPSDSRQLFCNLTNVEELDLTGADTSNVTDMSSMFNGMTSLTSLDLSSFDTSNVTSMFLMFEGMTSLTSLDLSSFDTSNVVNMSSMFKGTDSLVEINVSGWNITDTFSFPNLKKIIAKNIIFPSDSRQLFYNLTNVEELDLTGADTSNVTDMSLMFGEMTSLVELDISGWHIPAGLELPNAKKIIAKNTIFPRNSRELFKNLTETTELDLTNANTSNVVSMYSMFEGMTSLTSLDLSSFDTSNVQYMSSMFKGMTSLKYLNLSSFDTSNVIEMYSMFEKVASLKTLDLSHFDTSNVELMYYMFRNMKSLETLNISSFSCKNAKSMTQMFSRNPLLKSIDISSFGKCDKLLDDYIIFDYMDSLETIYASEEFPSIYIPIDTLPKLRGGLGSRTTNGKIDTVNSPGVFTYKYDYKIDNYDYTDYYIFSDNGEINLDNIELTNGVIAKVENNKLNFYIGGYHIKQFGIVGYNDNTDFSKGYIYDLSNKKCDRIIHFNGLCKYNNDTNMIEIYDVDELIESAKYVTLELYKYSIKDNNLLIGVRESYEEKDFNLNYIRPINSRVEEKDGYVNLYYEDELIDTFKIYSGIRNIRAYTDLDKIKIGQTSKINYVINEGCDYPETLDDTSVRYRSSNPDVITVDDDGNVKGVSEGMGFIEVTTSNGLVSNVQYEVSGYSVFENSFVYNVTVKQSNVNEVILSWDAVEEATKYEIYRSTDDKNYTKIAVSSENSYADNTILENVKTYYKVRAINDEFGYYSSGYSLVVSITTMLNAPAINVNSYSYNSIKINYENIVGVDGYMIYRATSKSGKYSLIKTTTDLSYIDTKLTTGKTYYYKVRAYSYSGKNIKYYSGYSSIKYDSPKVVKPTFSVNSYDYNKNKIVINKTSGATGYAIYRSTSENGKYSKIATTTGTTYYDSNLTTGKTYYYKVVAYRTVFGSKKYGYYSDIVNCITTLRNPSFTINNSSRDSIIFNIAKVNGATGYYIYEIVDGEETFVAKIKTLTYTLKNLELGTTHKYIVKAYRTVNKNDVIGNGKAVEITVKPVKLSLKSVITSGYNQSLISANNEIKEGDEAKIYVYASMFKDKEFSLVYEENVNSLNFDITELLLDKYYYYKAIVEINGVKSIESNVVKITTKLLSPSVTVKSNSYNSIKISYEEVIGADGYVIYRATSKNGKYSLIKTTTALSYTDTKLTTGKNYYYKVKAYAYYDTKTKNYGSFSSYKNAKPTVIAPGVVVSSHDYNINKITITKPAGSSGYQIYRSETGSNGTYKLIATTTSLTYYDKKLTTGKEYYYKVRAYRKVGVTKYYGYNAAPVLGIPSLKTPSVSIINSSVNSLEINITKVNGATGYNIYEIVDGENVLITNTTSLKYIHNNLELGSIHKYKVVAYRGDVLSDESSEIEYTVRPSKPLVKVTSPTFNSHNIYSELQDIKEEDKIKLYLYQSTSIDGEYTLIYEGSYINENDKYILDYTADNLILNKTYYYKVRIEINGVSSEEVLVSGKASIKPTLKSYKYNNQKNYILIETILDKDIDGYQIYRASTKNGKYSLVYDGSSNTKIFKGTYGSGYYYKVRYYKEYDGKKIYSELSNAYYVKYGDKSLKNYVQ